MNPDDLQKLMKRILVWIPESNPIRKEVVNIIEQIKNSREKLPPVEIVKTSESSNDEIIIYDTQDVIKQS
jgi:hypothetical protein